MAELETRFEALGPYSGTGPPPATDPREALRRTITYLRNNHERMNYAEYRRQGLPVTSSAVESLIKEFNYRVKGTEKFWDNPEGAEAILQVRAAVLSDDNRLARTSTPGQAALSAAIGSRRLRKLRKILESQRASYTQALMARVAAGEVSVWLLGWIPLMRGGDESAIIAQWREQVEARLTDARHLADIGYLALTFATLADCRAAWDRGLKGWNMQTSPLWDEIRAEAREEAKAEQTRVLVVQLGRDKFGKAPTRKQQAELEAIADLEQLEQLARRVLLVDSWSNLLNGHATP